MGIRMLHRLGPDPRHSGTVWTYTAPAPAASGTAVPVVAAGASAVRHPSDPRTRLRRAGADAGRALARRAPDRQVWADLARGYLALLLARLPKARPRHTLTVFVASLTDRPAPAGPRRPPRPATPGQRRPGPRKP
ncbi:hypothetical protein [Streptomyces sp. NPDC046860]|uniref:hypothetical protein n=1 Tax=Streptomyces sp. NPDC046860 TaxID=3154495 RepID=UPI0033DCD97E